MMLRSLQRAGWLPQLVRAASSSANPTVYDKIVTLTVVDKLGRRHAMRGLEGQSLAELFMDNEEQLGDDVMCLSPEGRDKWDAHIKVPNELADRLPLASRDDRQVLEQVAEPAALDQHSRLASKVVLSKDLNGALIAIAPNYTWKTL